MRSSWMRDQGQFHPLPRSDPQGFAGIQIALADETAALNVQGSPHGWSPPIRYDPMRPHPLRKVDRIAGTERSRGPTRDLASMYRPPGRWKRKLIAVPWKMWNDFGIRVRPPLRGKGPPGKPRTQYLSPMTNRFTTGEVFYPPSLWRDSFFFPRGMLSKERIS